ncbi:MAG TPA: SDR family NAD(P)-dependent oxidoreductase, partial [Thermomicrobiales bacterium]|nr:SDR family NAD(P)-dependent oxidoreductase [Thermomicrobiales bacterium]
MKDGEQRERAVLITGGGHGIGQGIAEAFAAAGDRVAVVDRDMARAADVAAGIRDRHGATAVPLAVDVRDAAAVEAMAHEATAAIGPIDVLVNNAGIYPNTPVVEMDEAEWDAVFDTNVKGVFLVSRAIARQMIARGEGGKIVNISSGAAKSGRIGAAHYCSSKAAVDMFTRVLAIELAPHGIAVNAVGPGLIEVPNAPLTREYVETLIAQTPMGRIGTPADIAQAVLYLASPTATFITGTTLYVD